MSRKALLRHNNLTLRADDMNLVIHAVVLPDTSVANLRSRSVEMNTAAGYCVRDPPRTCIATSFSGPEERHPLLPSKKGL
jgi:hypothetical protein